MPDDMRNAEPKASPFEITEHVFKTPVHTGKFALNDPKPTELTILRNLTNLPLSAPHSRLLVIPGPIEVTDDVLYANAHPSMSHVSPDFVPVLGDCLRMTKEVLNAPSSQPFIIAGSGTLGWDQVAANLIEPGEDVLVLVTGYFGDSFGDCLSTYGAKVEHVIASPVGAAITEEALEVALKAKKFKAVTFTHVDTSTGVLNDARMIAQTVKRMSPGTLVIGDCVCSVASEEIQQEQWGIDVVLTGSQKGIGAPPGVSILVASQRAIQVFKSRSTPVTSYYAGWHKWLPIMQAYEAGKPMYFATPPTSLCYALHAALSAILKGTPTLQERLQMHRDASARVRQACSDLGLRLVATDPKWSANGMSAIYAPDGITPGDLISHYAKKNIVIAGGLHKDIKDKYIRIGHMGTTVVDRRRGDLEHILSSLKEAINGA